MSLHDRPLAIGKLTGTIYDFDDVGDELPLHVHGEHDINISIVARGSVRAFGPDDAWELVATTGAVLDWQVGQWHGFVALEPNTRLVNVVKG